MSGPDFETLRRLFDLAMATPAADRAALLERECPSNPALKRRIEAMIAAADDRAPAFDHSRHGDGMPTGDFDSPVTVESTHVEGPGTRIGPYRILQLIGEGGFGSVFMAEQEKPVARRVALKIIKLGMDTRQVVARFEQERQALAMMDHPNIAKVFDAGATETGRPYFAMELVKGEPMVDYCDRNNLPIKDRLELFAQVCHAVQHAHTKGIIHRDIKPSNVLVGTQDGRPHTKVIDFGIAKATSSKLTEKTLFTEHRQLIGTPEYMSPEQAEGSLDIDTRTDVYSLGVLLYELLTGTTPFSTRELRSAAYAEIQRIIREVEPPKPSTRLSNNTDTIASVAARRHTEPRKLGIIVRGELDWIVMRALEKDRQRRYESASGLATDIQRYLSGEAVLAAPPSAAYRARKFVRRHKGPAIAGGMVAAALVFGLIGTAWQARIASRERDAAVKAQSEEAAQRLLAEAARAEAVAQRAKALEQEAEARKQKSILDGVVAFQSDMFKAVDPFSLPKDPVTGEPLRDRVTVLQAIQAASKSIEDGSLIGQPLVEAGVRRTIGDTLLALGRYDEALVMLKKALEIRRATLPPGDISIAASMDSLANVLQFQDKYAQAESLFREALAIRRASLPAGDQSIRVAMNNLAVNLQEQNKLPDAEALLREILALEQTSPADDPRNLAVAHDNLGKVLTLQAKLEEGEQEMRTALTIRMGAFASDHPEVALGKFNLATVLSRMNKVSEAEQLSREALVARRAAFPAGHPEIAVSVYQLASLLNKQGRISDAEPLYREALAIRRASLPAMHTDVAQSLNGLALLLKRDNRFEEAESLYREAINIRRAALPPGHPDIATPLSNLAHLLVEEKKDAEAVPLFREVVSIRRAALAADHPSLTKSILNLANALDRLGEFAEAQDLYDEVIPRLRQADPAGSAELARVLWRAGEVRMKNGKAREALPLLEQAVPMAERYLKAEDEQLPQCRESLSQCRTMLNEKSPSPARKENVPRATDPG